MSFILSLSSCEECGTFRKKKKPLKSGRTGLLCQNHQLFAVKSWKYYICEFHIPIKRGQLVTLRKVVIGLNEIIYVIAFGT